MKIVLKAVLTICILPAAAAVGTASLCALQGCSFFGNTRTVVIALPEAPPDWERRFPGLRYSLRFPDPADPASISSVTVPAGEHSVSIEVPKAAYIPCLAVPHPPEGRLKPAGMLITENSEGAGEGGVGADSFTPVWEDGFGAELLLQLFYRDEIYHALNCERLMKELREAAEGNVWALDPGPVRLGLSFGSFRSDKIRLLPTAAVEIPLDGGRWFWGNPFRRPENITAAEELVLLEVPVGSHHLYHADSAEHISIHIGEKEWYAVYSLRGMCISGSL